MQCYFFGHIKDTLIFFIFTIKRTKFFVHDSTKFMDPMATANGTSTPDVEHISSSDLTVFMVVVLCVRSPLLR